MSSDLEKTSKLDAFDHALALPELNLTAVERERMREGYEGLQRLIARMPRELVMEAEPAIVATPPGVRSTR